MIVPVRRLSLLANNRRLLGSLLKSQLAWTHEGQEDRLPPPIFSVDERCRPGFGGTLRIAKEQITSILSWCSYHGAFFMLLEERTQLTWREEDDIRMGLHGRCRKRLYLRDLTRSPTRCLVYSTYFHFLIFTYFLIFLSVVGHTI